MIDTVNDSLNAVVAEVGDTMQNVAKVANDTLASADAFSFLTWIEQHTVLVSVVIFVLGWLLTRLFSRIDDFIKRRNYRNTVLDWINIIAPIEENLASSLDEMAQKMKATDDMQPLRYEMPLTIPDKIKDMSVERMMDSFLHGWYCEETKKKRTAHMYNIISLFEYLIKVNDEIKTNYESYNKQTLSLCEQWNELNNQLRLLLNRYQSTDINAVIYKFEQDYKQTPNSLTIRNEFLEHLCSFVDSKSREMELIQRMYQIMVQIDVYHKRYADVFSGQSALIKDSITTLNKAESYFRN